MFSRLCLAKPATRSSAALSKATAAPPVDTAGYQESALAVVRGVPAAWLTRVVVPVAIS